MNSKQRRVDGLTVFVLAAWGILGILNSNAMADYAAAVLADNPLGYWRFNEADGDVAFNSGTDGSELDGEYIDAPRVPGPDQVNGQAIIGLGAGNLAISVGDDFDSYVAVDASPLNDVLSEDGFTFEGWVNAGERVGGRIGLWGQNDVPEFGFIAPNRIQLWTPGGGNVNWDFTEDDIEDETWFHVVGTSNFEETILYINGEEVQVGPGQPNETYGNSSFTFNIGGGGVYDATGNQFLGLIDEVAIWTDRVLTAEEIKVHFDAAFQPAGDGSPRLQAGDADQDLDFDQLDLVQVQIAAKYLTGAPATWGEGDWNGAPGGSSGAPPAGDGVFDQLDIIAALNANVYLTGPYAAINGGGVRGDNQTSIIYNPTTGELGVDTPAGTDLTSINIESAAAILTGDPAQNLGGSFDNDSDNNIFKATFGSSFGSLSFGNVAQTGLTAEFVQNDLTVVGSLAGGGDLGSVDLIYIPEPSSLLLAGLGLIGLIGFAYRSRRAS